MPSSFYEPLAADRFASTESTVGPWGTDSQHGGPPAALLGRSIERMNERDDMQLARITFEILAPVPVADLTVGTRLVRPGRNVEFIEATLAADGKEVMRAHAWRIRTTTLALDVATGPPPPPAPNGGRDAELFDTSQSFGYLSAMEWRFVKGNFVEPGPATAWLRMRHALVAGEEITPLSRILIAADSSSGISSELDWRTWLFINPDLSVYLHRYPAGEWICLDATTTLEPHGIGLTAARLYDERGAIGQSTQSLFIAARD